jgi:hypothetical protein
MAREILIHVIGEYVAWVPLALVVIFSPALARFWIWILGVRYPEARPALDEAYRDAMSWWRPLNFIFASLIFMVDAAKLASAQAQAERDGKTRTAEPLPDAPADPKVMPLDVLVRTLRVDREGLWNSVSLVAAAAILERKWNALNVGSLWQFQGRRLDIPRSVRGMGVSEGREFLRGLAEFVERRVAEVNGSRQCDGGDFLPGRS